MQDDVFDDLIVIGAEVTRAKNGNTSYGSGATILGTTPHPVDDKACAAKRMAGWSVTKKAWCRTSATIA